MKLDSWNIDMLNSVTEAIEYYQFAEISELQYKEFKVALDVLLVLSEEMEQVDTKR
jgi:hypothetical protein